MLKNEAIQKAYKQLGPEFSLVEMIIDQRLKQGLTSNNWQKKSAVNSRLSPVLNKELTTFSQIFKARGCGS